MMYKVHPELHQNDRTGLSSYSDLLAHLLFNRNIKTNEEAESFLNAEYEKHTHDPALLKDAERAAKEILEMIKENKKICIFSDYDADGIPGAVILHDFFKKIGYQNFFNYIPHRNTEGFGLNKKAIQKIKDNGADLIITIDCGITNIEEVDLVNTLGLKIIITDHHELGKVLPKAFAIVNPKQDDCRYPEKMLCGSGVIFKLVSLMIRIGNQSGQFEIKEGWEKWLLDMVGIATLSDMVPLVGENRVLAKYGLVVLKKSPRKGLIRLLRETGTNQSYLNEDDVGFSISPRINAASRMDAPEIAFRMLSTIDDIEADQTVIHLHKINNERKGVVSGMVKEINKSLNHLEEDSIPPIIVKGNPKWKPSLLGLAANSLIDKYNRPVFLWGRGEGDNLKGSCRSNGTVNIVDLMKEIPDGIIGEFGGHEMAGGFTIEDNAVYDFDQQILEAFEKIENNPEGIKTLMVDKIMNIDEVGWNLFDELKKLAPFGVENNNPIFLFKSLPVFKVEKFGKEKNHLKLIFRKTSGELFPAIKFFADGEIFQKIKPNDSIDLIASLEKSVFGGKVELRLKIIDLCYTQ